MNNIETFIFSVVTSESPPHVATHLLSQSGESEAVLYRMNPSDRLLLTNESISDVKITAYSASVLESLPYHM